MSMVEMKCHCGEIYYARQADLNRGWGLTCSKSCAAKRKTHKFRAATYSNGNQLPKHMLSNKPKRKKKAKPERREIVRIHGCSCDFEEGLFDSYEPQEFHANFSNEMDTDI